MSQAKEKVSETFKKTDLDEKAKEGFEQAAEKIEEAVEEIREKLD